MTDKFLGTGSVGGNIANGTISIYGSKIGAKNLDPSRAIKTDSQGRLQTTDLDIADVNNLQSILDNVIINPYTPPIGEKFTVIGNIECTNTIDAPYVALDRLFDSSKSISIDLNSTTVNVLSPYLNFNDEPIIHQNYPSYIQASSFKKTGAVTGAGEYLMADGTTIKYSQNSGNSNFYIYNNVNGASPPPVSFDGKVSYNNSAQASATVIYITHLTRDNIDIEIFYAQISSINDLYIQDQENSENFIKYNITAATYISNQYLTLSVIATSAGGTGYTNFGNGHNIIISFFQNSPEISQRLSQLESKTTNIASVTVGVSTQFQGAVLTDKTTFTDNNELISKLYADSLISGYVPIKTSLIQRGGRFFTNKFTSSTKGGTTGTFFFVTLPTATYISGTNIIPINDIQTGDIYVFTVSGKCTLPSGSQSGFIFIIGSQSHTCLCSTNPIINAGNFEIISRWTCVNANTTSAIFNVSSIGHMGNTGQTSTSCVFGSTTTAITIDNTITNTCNIAYYNPTSITCSVTVYNLSLQKE